MTTQTHRTRRTFIVATMAVLLLAAGALTDTASAQKGKPGFIDLAWIQIPTDASDVQEIDLTALLGQLAAEATDDGEHQLARLLGMMDSVHVKSYTLKREDKATLKAVERINEQLTKDDWSRLVYFREESGATTTASIKSHEGRIVGLTVVMYEPQGNVGFVNVTGRLDLGLLLSLISDGNLAGLADSLATVGKVN
jgi:hypothetical protein